MNQYTSSFGVRNREEFARRNFNIKKD